MNNMDNNCSLQQINNQKNKNIHDGGISIGNFTEITFCHGGLHRNFSNNSRRIFEENSWIKTLAIFGFKFNGCFS